MDDKTFGQWLIEKREAAGLNQTELALRAHVSKNYISLLERDLIEQPRKPKLENIGKALSAFLTIKPQDVLNAAGFKVKETENKNVERTKKINPYLDELNQDNYEEIIEIIKLKLRRQKLKTLPIQDEGMTIPVAKTNLKPDRKSARK